MTLKNDVSYVYYITKPVSVGGNSNTMFSSSTKHSGSVYYKEKSGILIV